MVVSFAFDVTGKLAKLALEQTVTDTDNVVLSDDGADHFVAHRRAVR